MTESSKTQMMLNLIQSDKSEKKSQNVDLNDGERSHGMYEKVLAMLRELDAGGKWPSTSRRRREIIRRLRDKESDSFTIGLFPPPLRIPHANKDLMNLLDALRELEALISPSRPPSTTVTVNRNAQFWPHTDSGAGAGQSTSLIVGLGDYTGGEVMVEGVSHNIRYTPLEFDGWKQEHWTVPFTGERYSLVWYIPQGLEPASEALRDGGSWQDVIDLTARQRPIQAFAAHALTGRLKVEDRPRGPITLQRFSMIPPSANLKGRLSRLAISELSAVNATSILLPELDSAKPSSFQGRVLFDAPTPAAFARLRACNSVRLVLLHEDFSHSLGPDAPTAAIAAWLVARCDWDGLAAARRDCGHASPAERLPVHVRCKQSSGRLGEGLVQVSGVQTRDRGTRKCSPSGVPNYRRVFPCYYRRLACTGTEGHGSAGPVASILIDRGTWKRWEAVVPNPLRAYSRNCRGLVLTQLSQLSRTITTLSRTCMC
jgi:hypothetical protein